MFGPRGKAVLGIALLLFACSEAQAKKQNFTTGSPLGLGLLAGLENRPKSAFAAGSQTTSSNYANYFAIEPFYDLVNVQFRLHAGWNFYPLLSGAGSDSNGSFTESSSAGSFRYGGRVLLSPFVGAKAESRFFFTVGVTTVVVKLKNSRKYLTGTMFNQTNSERLQGTGTEISGGVGYEFYLLQNYSMLLEAGYTSRSVSTFSYQTSTDVSGTTRKSGETAKDASGGDKGFHTYSPYFQIGLNLNL